MTNYDTLSVDDLHAALDHWRYEQIALQKALMGASPWDCDDDDWTLRHELREASAHVNDIINALSRASGNIEEF